MKTVFANRWYDFMPCTLHHHDGDSLNDLQYDCWCLPVDRCYRYSFAPANQSSEYRTSPGRGVSYYYLEIV